MEGKNYLLALSQCDIMGPSRLKRLWAFFNSWELAWKASSPELQAAGLNTVLVAELTAFRKTFSFEKMFHELERHGIKTVAPEESDYPALLKQSYQPPLLYYKGSLSIFNAPTLAIVGSRKTTPYGIQVTNYLTEQLSKAGLTIVSGLALGIDTLAHAATLETQGLTAAVLGCGLDNIYPASNRLLAQKINETGCIISEFKIGTPAFKTNFPRRNRLIAGLSLGTLVIEAAEKSGALSTARHALHENREVMAIPGNIFSPASIGTNNLIKLGARLVTTAQDVLSALGLENISSISSPKTVTVTPEESKILEHISFEPIHINEIARLTQLDISSINSRLTIMEINGLVKNTGNLSYVRLL